MRVRINRNRAALLPIAIWILMFFISGGFGLIGSFFSTNNEVQSSVSEDPNMTTNGYYTDIQIQPDNSYLITEEIDVSFDVPRHGIYRYIPKKGVISEVNEEGAVEDVPYYAAFENITSNKGIDVSSDNGNEVIRFGEEDEYVSGNELYRLQYKVTPITSEGYKKPYYNIFPTGWQNEIPEGSSFAIHFPAEVDEHAVQLYYGRYGEQINATEILDLKWDDQTLYGVLKSPLEVGTGLTFFASVGDTYFESVHSITNWNLILVILCVVLLVVLSLLYFFFGRDQEMISSVQFQPPADLDSAAVGYIVDGNVSDIDVLSLILYWADRGYIKIKETEEKSLTFVKLKDMPEDAPDYVKLFFDKLFGSYVPIGHEVKVSSLKYKMAEVVLDVKQKIKKMYASQVYTSSSKAARIVAFILSIIPFFVLCTILINTTFVNIVMLVLPVLYTIGLLLFAQAVDYWYSKTRFSRNVKVSISMAMSGASALAFLFVYGPKMYGNKMLNLLPALIAVVIYSYVAIILTGFMKKRTNQCVQWMGYLTGLRDFIEMAELERMKVIAKDSPQLFYHILPYAYVFGLTDILLDKMNELALPAPEWYENPTGDVYFNYFVMHRFMHANMNQITTTITTPKPVESSGGSGNGISGGGFSGGGFGGGGGGSW